MSYTALYRKWRPVSFSEIVGQETIIQTLLNQIQSGRVAHAYLFCGTRGTGKTTTAKIFSRAVNCLAMEGEIPCNVCASCVSILEETNMDVFEMDAASNNGVDDIRELREHVKYPPSNGRYKVYIIDEVHMLSKGAFNALLKTLEEPPPHIIFILATTEPHKIPATIHSRCQRFDFKRVSYDAVTAVLQEICAKEGRSCEPEALRLIVQCSEGAMRDALSILDRCLSFEEGMLTHERVLDILGLSGDQFLITLTESLLGGSPDEVLSAVGYAVSEGKDLNQLIRESVEFFRKLLLVQVSKNPEQLLDVSKETQAILATLAERAGTGRLMSWLTQFSKLDSEAKWTPHPRALLEMALIRLIYDLEAAPNDQLLIRLEKLEKRFDSMGNVPLSGPIASVVSKDPGVSGEVPKITELQNRPASAEIKRNSPEVTHHETKSPGIPPGNAIGQDLQVFVQNWSGILSALKKIRISTYALMVEGELSEFKSPVLTVTFKEQFEFHRMAMEKEENRSHVEMAIEQQTGIKVRLNCVQSSAGIAKAVDSPEWVSEVKDFFKGHEDKITIDTKEE